MANAKELLLQYQIRRGGQIGPNSFTVEQLKQMYASGSLVLTDEVSPEGQNQWKPLSEAFKGGQAAAAQAAPPTTGGDWLMKQEILSWIFRGCLMLLIISVILPWWSVSAGPHSNSWLGIVHWPGILVLLLAGAALGGTWAPIPHRQWLVVGPGLSLILTCIVLIGMGSPTPEAGGPSLVEGLSEIARRGMSFGWRGIGMFVALLASLGATTFGVFIFIQHLKQRPAL